MTISEMVVLYLKHYPKNNQEEFQSLVQSEADQNAVQAILTETLNTPIEFGTKPLSLIGQEIQTAMHALHPDLSPEALKCLGNYFTYLVK